MTTRKRKKGSRNTEITDPNAAPPAPSVPERSHGNLVPITIFKAASKHKDFQLGGFSMYAQLNNMTLLTMSGWEEAYQAFLRRPIR